MSVKRAQAEIDSAEYAEWLAYYRLEPFDLSRSDLRAAMISCTMANVHRGKNQKAFKVEDFMPKFGSQLKPKQTPAQMRAVLNQVSEGLAKWRP